MNGRTNDPTISVLPEITVALVWVSQQEIEALVNATETLEITRREPGITWTTTPTTPDAATTPPTDEPEEKEAEPTAEQTQQGQIYHIQTKTLDRPVTYISNIRVILLPFGFQFLGTGGHDVARGLQFVAHHAVVIALPLVSVLPRRLLHEIYVGKDNATSATESLSHVLAGVDQFTFWESSVEELVLWWLSLLRQYWWAIGCVLMLVLVYIMVVVFS